MASPFASLIVSDPIPLPFDAGQWVKVRKLTGREYDKVRSEPRDGDRWHGFDRYALVSLGLVEWSYERAIGPDSINDLDDDAVDVIALEVLKLTKPWLFIKAAAEAEHDEKKG